MHEHTIGVIAGNVWSKLNDQGEMSVSALKKAVGSQDATVDWAIGWLAREGKISFRKEKNILKISLK